MKKIFKALFVWGSLLFLDALFLGWVGGTMVPANSKVLWAGAFFIGIGFIGIMIWTKKIDKTLDRMAQGLDGEKGVGLYLNRLWSETSFVFHDLQGNWENGNPFNIDHLIVSKRGVFVVETKTLSKSEGHANEISVVNGNLFVNGLLDKFDMQGEAERHAKWISKYLHKQGVPAQPVISVLLFPRWKVNATWNRENPQNLVFSAKAFVTEFAYFTEQVSSENFEKAKKAICKLARGED